MSDPRQAKAFRFVRATYAAGEAQLVYAFDDGSELVERIVFPDAPPLAAERTAAFAAALRLLHLIAGVRYYKAGVPCEIVVEGEPRDEATAALLDAVYLSAVTFTTVGFGDVAPVGPIRFLSGTMALTGFVLVTWSASFTYLEMERFWRR